MSWYHSKLVVMEPNRYNGTGGHSIINDFAETNVVSWWRWTAFSFGNNLRSILIRIWSISRNSRDVKRQIIFVYTVKVCRRLIDAGNVKQQVFINRCQQYSNQPFFARLGRPEKQAKVPVMANSLLYEISLNYALRNIIKISTDTAI